MKKILCEPLVHFMLLGAILFLLYGMVGRRAGPAPEQIVVTEGRIEQLEAGFTKAWHRPPSSEELDGLIRDYVRSEVSCREAVALGLDRDDAVIRNRLRLKLEFVSEDIAALAEPTDEQLKQYLREHVEAFRPEPRFSFVQVYLNPQRRLSNLSRDATAMLSQLNQTGANADVSELGDSFLLDHTFEAAPLSEVGKLFGEKFAAQLRELEPGQWHGMVQSTYGAHLVFISRRLDGQLPALNEVHEAVRRTWLEARRQKTIDDFYSGLLKRYSVTIEKPQPAAGQRILAAVERTP